MYERFLFQGNLNKFQSSNPVLPGVAKLTPISEFPFVSEAFGYDNFCNFSSKILSKIRFQKF